MKCEVREGAIHISIDAACLKTATDYSPEFWDGETERYRFIVTNPDEWVKSVARRITAEREDGSSLLTDMFDDAIVAAVHGGEEGVDDSIADMTSGESP